MLVVNDFVQFHKCDMQFVKKFGLMDATDMVLDFYSCNKHPFVYDTYQLAGVLGLRRGELFYMLKDPSRHYREFFIRKSNGKLRHICAPKYDLQWVQGVILRKILNCFQPSRYATAYRIGVRLQDNAEPHIGKKYLLKMDLADFFGSIRFQQVYSAVFNSRYFPKQIGVMLTTLCCYQDVLPQGAATSPAISNLVMRHFDDALGSWCEKHGVTYTRYCDDLTFSADVPLYRVFLKAKGMLEEMGFSLNTSKTRFVTHATRQSVTGLIVNEKLSVPSEYRRQLRQECYYAIRYGVENAILHGNRQEFIKDGEILGERYLNHLIGRVRYVLQIDPENKAISGYLHKLLYLKN